MKSHQRKANKDKMNVECYSCGKKGHFKSECWSQESSEDDESDSKRRDGRNRGNRNKKGFVARKQKEEVSEWIADSGASFHMTGDRSIFASYTELEQPFPVPLSTSAGTVAGYRWGTAMRECR